MQSEVILVYANQSLEKPNLSNVMSKTTAEQHCVRQRSNEIHNLEDHFPLVIANLVSNSTNSSAYGNLFWAIQFNSSKLSDGVN